MNGSFVASTDPMCLVDFLLKWSSFPFSACPSCCSFRLPFVYFSPHTIKKKQHRLASYLCMWTTVHAIESVRTVTTFQVVRSIHFLPNDSVLSLFLTWEEQCLHKLVHTLVNSGHSFGDVGNMINYSNIPPTTTPQPPPSSPLFRKAKGISAGCPLSLSALL